MRLLFFLFFIIPASVTSQEAKALVVKSTKLPSSKFISVDNFGAIYFTKNNTLFKKNTIKSLSYNNFQLGELSSINTFNPLKINLFYKEFNTVVILDNRLSEIFKIDFNVTSPYKNVTHVSTGFDNTIWVFNQNQQQLELYDYKTKTTRSQTAPIQNAVLDLKSDYNYCWLLTKNYLYQFNYFGALVNKIDNTGFTALQVANENCILQKGNSLLLLKEKNKNLQEIKIPNLSINGFSVTNETLYIYQPETLYKLQLKTD